MGTSIGAIAHGIDYQAHWFWLKATKLFLRYNPTEKVQVEESPYKGFDDIAVFYSEPLRERNVDCVSSKHFQVKGHVDQSGHITAKKLIEPSFINASSNSLLENLYRAYTKATNNGEDCLFTFIDSRIISPDDPLANLIGNDGCFRLEVLNKGKTDKSKMGKIRKLWREHLGVTDEELNRVLSHFKITSLPAPTNLLIETLNAELRNAGLKSVDLTRRNNDYVGLLRSLIRDDKLEFTVDSLKQECESEGLWVGTNIHPVKSSTFGIRSFLRGAENMEEETESTLCLLDEFNGRMLKPDNSWFDDIKSRVENFLLDNLSSEHENRLILDSHSPIAFTAGYYLDAKSGKQVFPIQKTVTQGRNLWKPEFGESRQTDYLSWKIREQTINSQESDVAISLSVTHDIGNDVDEYVRKNSQTIEKFLDFKLDSTSQTAIENADHAHNLAESLIDSLSEWNSAETKFHVFLSCPNALAFFIGQQSRVLGELQLYDYDFEQKDHGTYEETITLNN